VGGWGGGSNVQPSAFYCQADNTAREHKNQNLMMFSGWLVASRRANSLATELFVVGHTHNLMDQRFSIVGTSLSTASILDTMMPKR
jgi:hypothetical protein